MARFRVLVAAVFLACGADPAGGPTGDAGSGGGEAGSGGGGWPEGLLPLSTPEDDEVLALAAAPGGGFWVAGFEHGLLGVRNLEPAGNAQGVLVRYDAAGRELERHVLDGAGAQVVDAVAASGHALVFAGRTESALPGQVHGGSIDGVVGRIEDGAVTALRQLGDDRPQHPRRVAVHPNGDVLVGGWDDVHAPGGAVESVEDPFAVSLDAALEPRWTRQWRTPGSDEIRAVAVAGDLVIVTGGVLAGPSRGSFVARLDPADGREIWRMRLSPAGFDTNAGVAVDREGHVVVAGSTLVALGEHAWGLQDALVARLHPDTGEILALTQFGSDAEDWVTDLSLSADGGVVVAGETLGSMEPGVANAGAADPFVATFDAELAWTGVWQRGTECDEMTHAVAIDEHGRILAGGSSACEMVPGLPPAGRRDGWVRRVEDGAPPRR